MTLDRATFTREMLLLAERFGRDISNPVMLRYYDTLRSRLTTEEFERAARIVFDHDAFWPAPIRFVYAVHGNPETNALGEWQRVLAAARQVEQPPLTPAGAVALRAVGGMREVQYADEWKLHRLERAFREAYRTASVAMPLPEAPGDDPLALTGGDDA
jgi:hypothetical protein